MARVNKSMKTIIVLLLTLLPIFCSAQSQIDTFTRADSTDMTVNQPPTCAWQQHSPWMGISTDRAYFINYGVYCANGYYSYVGMTNSATSGDLYVTWSGMNNGGIFFRAGRIPNDGEQGNVTINGYYIFWYGSSYTLGKSVIGSSCGPCDQGGDFITTFGTATAGDIIHVNMSGSTITIYINGSSQYSFTDSLYTSNNISGLMTFLPSGSSGGYGCFWNNYEFDPAASNTSTFTPTPTNTATQTPTETFTETPTYTPTICGVVEIQDSFPRLATTPYTGLGISTVGGTWLYGHQPFGFSGETWSDDTGWFLTGSNTADALASPVQFWAYQNAQSSDGTVWTQVNRWSHPTYAGVSFRRQDDNNIWCWELNSSADTVASEAYLVYYQNTTGTLVSDITGLSMASGVTLSAILNGSTITCMVNYTPVAIVNNSFLSTKTGMGMTSVSDSGTYGDVVASFEYDAPACPPTPTPCPTPVTTPSAPTSIFFQTGANKIFGGWK